MVHACQDVAGPKTPTSQSPPPYSHNCEMLGSLAFNPYILIPNSPKPRTPSPETSDPQPEKPWSCVGPTQNPTAKPQLTPSNPKKPLKPSKPLKTTQNPAKPRKNPAKSPRKPLKTPPKPRKTPSKAGLRARAVARGPWPAPPGCVPAPRPGLSLKGLGFSVQG